jgi:NAD(P)-dependent dehydrogenase (short-subunit alcohol dehydrogenase family)
MSKDPMQSVLVTGANSGIGRATAIELAGAGHRVYAAMRDTQKAEKLLRLASEAGCEVETVVLDVTDDASVRGAVAKVQREAGGVDVLVNNAGIGYNATTEDIDIDAAKHVFDTNYWGAVRCIQAVLPKMRERRSGHIVNVSSITGRIAALAQTVYASSKWALECMSENLAQEVAPFGVRVTVIEPGIARTAILPKNITCPEPTVYEDAYRRLLQFYAKGIEANVRPEEVAATIRFALSDPECRFRYICAWGGRELIEGRRRMTDEDWVELGRSKSDEEYYTLFERLFGLDLRTSS